MEVSKLKNIAWVCFALLFTTTVLAQGNGNRNNYNQEGCSVHVAGLTTKQQTQIQNLEEEHQKVMAELRGKRRATTDVGEKTRIRTEMLEAVEAHHSQVKKVLTPDQQKQYNQLHMKGSFGRNQNVGRGRGNSFASEKERNYHAKGKRSGNSSRANSFQRYGECKLSKVSCFNSKGNIDTSEFQVIEEIEFN